MGSPLKAGKFVTLLGYEVIESPNNLNFSRGYLFTLAIPLTHTGGLASYTFTDWFSMTAGVVLGWDDSKNVNDSVELHRAVRVHAAQGLHRDPELDRGPGADRRPADRRRRVP